MSKNLQQVYTTNPIVTNQATDLMYFARSPYAATDDCGMTYSSFASQFGAPYTPSALTSTNDTNVTITLGGTPATSLLHAASLTMGWTGLLSPTRGGTGVNNGASTFTIGGSFAMSGAFTFTGTLTGNTAVTFPISGTLATTSQIPTGAALTEVNDTNVTLTLGGSPTTALVNAASITAGWTGQLSLARGGTNASLTASNGGIFYSTSTAGAILAGTATANQVLLSGSSSSPSWSTATYPPTTTINQLLYSSAANTISGLSTANSATLVTNSSGVPALTASLTNGQIVIGSTGATPTPATLTAGTNVSITNAAGSITINNTASAGITNVNQNTSTVTLAANNRYAINNGASLVTLTLPVSPTIGDTYIIVGGSSGGWIVAQNASQQCHLGSSATTSGAGGSLASSNQYDCITITCVATNTFSVYGVQGAITVV